MMAMALFPGNFFRKPDIPGMVEIQDVDGLIRLLRNPDLTLQWKAAEGLGKIGEPAIPALLNALRHPVMENRIGVIEALGSIRDHRAVTPLIDLLLHEQRDDVRFLCTLALGEIGDVRAVPACVLALRDKNKYVRFGAASALIRLGWIPPTPMDQAYLYIARQNWDGLPALGEEAADPLIETLKDPDPYIRSKAVALLGTMRIFRAKEASETVLRDVDGKVRWNALVAFPQCGIPPLHIPRGVARRRRIGQDPRIAALLNFLFLGIGYNYLGKWWGFLLFQVNLTLILTASLWLGPLLPQITSYGVSSIFSIHAYIMGTRMHQDLA
jgi:hypothetical protein